MVFHVKRKDGGAMCEDYEMVLTAIDKDHAKTVAECKSPDFRGKELIIEEINPLLYGEVIMVKHMDA